MSYLCIQIHPNRAPDLDVAAVRTLCKVLASKEPLLNQFTVAEENDEGPYVNLMFESNSLQALWELLQRYFYQDKTIGALMRKASIATCEGDRGWDDYLLLHHFDQAEQLDDFTSN